MISRRGVLKGVGVAGLGAAGLPLAAPAISQGATKVTFTTTTLVSQKAVARPALTHQHVLTCAESLFRAQHRERYASRTPFVGDHARRYGACWFRETDASPVMIAWVLLAGFLA